MILFFYIFFQLTGETQKILYYDIPSNFLPYISTTRAYGVPEDYKIKKGDILSIVFYGTFNQIYYQQVTNSGEIWIITSPTSLNIPFKGLKEEEFTKITGPNLGFFRVENKSVKEIEKMINKALKEKYTGTIARVFLAEIGDIEVHIVGNVKNPGSYLIKGLKRVYDAIQKAGPPGKIEKVILKRNGISDTLYISRYLSQGDLKENPYLQNGDIIIIPWNSK